MLFKEIVEGRTDFVLRWAKKSTDTYTSQSELRGTWEQQTPAYNGHFNIPQRKIIL